MKAPPLQLERYFFTRTVANANPGFDPVEAGNAGDAERDVDVQVQLFRNDTDPHQYQLTLSVVPVAVGDTRPPYELEVEAVGFFSVNPNFEHPDMDRLVQVNGASLLYSAAREYVMTVTGRGPWGPFLLPTVNFHASPPADLPREKAPGKRRKSATS